MKKALVTIGILSGLTATTFAMSSYRSDKYSDYYDEHKDDSTFHKVVSMIGAVTEHVAILTALTVFWKAVEEKFLGTEVSFWTLTEKK